MTAVEGRVFEEVNTVRINDREQFLLRVLGGRRYLDAAMIQKLFYWDRTPRTARYHLGRLVELGLLDRATFEPLVGTPDGPRNYVYWLTTRSAQLVEATFGEEVSLPRGRKRGDAYDPTVEHVLAANALYVALVEAWREGTGLARVEWRDEWGGAMLKIPLLAAESKRRGVKHLHFRPDAFVGLTLVSQGELGPVEPDYGSGETAQQWETVQDWGAMFPDFSPLRAEGVEKVVLQMAFVESDMGKSSRQQLQGKIEKYHFVRKRPDQWVPHYGVPLVGPDKRPLLWPGMLVLSQTERRMRTLAEVFAHPQNGYGGWVLLACFDWDEPDEEAGKDDEDRVQNKGLVKGPVWFDPQGGRERLTFMEAIRGLSKG